MQRLVITALCALGPAILLAAGPTASGGETGAGARTSRPHLGFNDDWQLIPNLAPRARAGGADAARFPFYWSAIERRRGVFDWKEADATISALRASGLRPLLAVQYAPCWARPSTPCPGAHGGYPPDRAFDWAWKRFLRKVARRYRHLLGIEIWNEPNGSLFWHDHPDPVRYARLLRISYRAIKSVRPGLRVISAGLAPAIADDERGWRAWRPFLRAVLSHGGARFSDAIALHPYPRFADALPDVGGQVSVARRLLARAGRPRHPIWVSEVGVRVGDAGVDPAEQATRLTGIYRLLVRRHVPVIIVHRFLEVDALPLDPYVGFGMLRRDLSPTPAYHALARLRGAGS